MTGTDFPSTELLPLSTTLEIAFQRQEMGANPASLIDEAKVSGFVHIGLVFRQFATCGGLFLTLCSGALPTAGGGRARAFQPFLTPWGGPVAAALRRGACGRARGARRGPKQRGVRPAHRSMGWNDASMGCFGRSIPWNFRSKATRGTREARFSGRKEHGHGRFPA